MGDSKLILKNALVSPAGPIGSRLDYRDLRLHCLIKNFNFVLAFRRKTWILNGTYVRPFAMKIPGTAQVRPCSFLRIWRPWMADMPKMQEHFSAMPQNPLRFHGEGPYASAISLAVTSAIVCVDTEDSPLRCNRRAEKPAAINNAGRAVGTAALADRMRHGCRIRAYMDVFTACRLKSGYRLLLH